MCVWVVGLESLQSEAWMLMDHGADFAISDGIADLDDDLQTRST